MGDRDQPDLPMAPTPPSSAKCLPSRRFDPPLQGQRQSSFFVNLGRYRVDVSVGAQDRIERILDDLVAQGWCALEGLFPPEAVAAMAGEVRSLWQRDAFHRAGVGQGEGLTVVDEIRRDHVLWIDETDPTSKQRPYLEFLEGLRLALNLELFLGLWDYEGHYALYPPGGFYKRHNDRFAGTAERVLTCILYLNPDWQPGDGGELRVFLPAEVGEQTLDLPPHGGTFFCFLTERFEHEVLPTAKERIALTGWFRRRDPNQIDAVPLEGVG
ncbi:MAG: 2OG-Fe(II) oxygenase [Alphaproteobacteria bacterium CG_4_10_14_0_2_um_filter_63_37]|nr:MAG: 2OG-Fe(II) oxygenase [Alphaproteobacteria bacterium CG_4_10_14_0_2_um_filter_63_37]